MCMRTVYKNGDVDTELFFEKDPNDTFKVEETYSFQIKDVIDNQFENIIFSFNSDDNWDEIETINLNQNMKWIKKCSYKLVIGKVCIQQFGQYNNRAEIKLKSKNTKRNK